MVLMSLSRVRAIVRPMFAAAAVAVLGGCAHAYLDQGTTEAPRSEFRSVDHPKAVHLVFEFQTKGAPNAGVTQALSAQVTEQVKESGLFSTVDAPAGPDTALLQVTLNNVPVTSESDAASKGFAAGFTFGLAGSCVTDGYICTVSYLPPGQSTPIVKIAHHAIHTTIGTGSAPKGAVSMPDFQQAVTTMTRQILSNALRDLSKDPNF